MESRRRQSLASTAAIAVAAVVLSFGCGSADGVELCGQIPDGGCPAGRGGTCDDAVCGGLYDCVEGIWTETESCPGNPTTTVATSSASGVGGGCDVPEISHEGEVDGCEPDLLEPDCPAVAAEVCAPCETGCADFFLCTADGWVDVGACAADGSFVHIFR